MMPTTAVAERAQLLSTKLFAPTHAPDLIARSRLVALLHQGARQPLTVVVAPTGFGKTTLLTEWLSQLGRPAGWVSLDRGDNDPTLFWAYVITALQGLDPAVGERPLAMLFSPEPPPIQVALTALINELAVLDGDVVVLLDDYHLIEDRRIHDGMAFFVDNIPPQVHLVIASRSEPPFPLGRLRGQGRLVEVTPADLRFTAAEAAAFLNDLMGLEVPDDAVGALERRTEGWIAGLQLAALSMRGRNDIGRFVASFSGDHRHIADVLVEEVLHRQTEEVQDFLLHTSVLERMCGPLCDAVTGGRRSRAVLEELERSHLFIVGLDERREWYRYHHLFADVLRARLIRDRPGLVRDLHTRASAWYEEHRLIPESVRHALESGDADRAADTVERAWRVMDRRFQSATWLGWAEALPPDAPTRRPVLSLGYGWALLDAGRFEEGEPYLDDAERWLDSPDPDRMIVADTVQFRSLAGTLAAARAYVAQAKGDREATERHARRALDLLPEDDPFYLGIPAVIIGLAQWSRGELADARRSFDDALHSYRRAGNIPYQHRAMYAIAEILRVQGRLSEAAARYEDALGFAHESPSRMTEAGSGLARILLERGDEAAAEARLMAGSDESEEERSHRWCMAMADLEEARADPESALQWLAEADRRYRPSQIPDTVPVSARRARILIALGRLEEAEAWAEERGVSLQDEPDFLREYELITLARLNLARLERGELPGDEIARLLDGLLRAARAGGRVGSQIEILVLQTRLHAFHRDDDDARACLERALELGGPERFHRVFMRDGAALRPWLREAVARGAHRGIARRLHAAVVGSGPENGPGTGQRLESPLTPREVEVMRLVAAGLRNKEIADQLFISTSTVKRHIANIYAKLGATHRAEAVAKANSLRLL